MKINELGLPDGALLEFDSDECRTVFLQVLTMPELHYKRVFHQGKREVGYITCLTATREEILFGVTISLIRQTPTHNLYLFEIRICEGTTTTSNQAL